MGEPSTHPQESFYVGGGGGIFGSVRKRISKDSAPFGIIGKEARSQRGVYSLRSEPQRAVFLKGEEGGVAQERLCGNTGQRR